MGPDDTSKTCVGLMHVTALIEGPLTLETVEENLPTFREERDDISDVSNTRNIVIENEIQNLN